MVEVEQLEFKRTLIASGALHLIVVGGVLATTSFSSFRYIEAPSPGPINVMWATSVRAPQETAPNKLPGPIVPIQEAAPTAEEKPNIVMPQDLKKGPTTKPESAEEARKRAMAEAVANLRRNLPDDDRPMPKADNFPSKGLKGAQEGVPSAPGGIAGILGGDPAFTSYKSQIQKVITNNFVWLQKKDESNRAEVSFSIDLTGNILDPAVSKSSGSAAFDSAALRAVRKSSPLPSPPQDIAQNLVKETIVIVFDPKRI